MVSYRRAKPLGSYLVRAKLYPLEKKGSCKCGNLGCLHFNINRLTLSQVQLHAGNFPKNYLSVFDNFVGLTFKGLR